MVIMIDNQVIFVMVLMVLLKVDIVDDNGIIR